MVFGGVDEDQERQFLDFCSDPMTAILGTVHDTVFRQRLNIISTEPLFRASFESICLEASRRKRSAKALAAITYAAPVNPANLVADATARNALRLATVGYHASDDTPLNTAPASEVLPELACAFLHVYYANLQVPFNRDIAGLVGLLKAKRQILLGMTAAEVKVFKGRSIVSLILNEQRSHSLGPSNVSTRDTSVVASRETSSVTVLSQPLNAYVPPQQTQVYSQQQAPQHYTQQTQPPSTRGGDWPSQPQKHGRGVKYPLVLCTKCKGNGHDALKCVIPHPQCQSTWVCGTCRGSGHSFRFCPSETL